MGVGEGLISVPCDSGAPVGSIVGSLDDLAALYRAPSEIAASKKLDVIDSMRAVVATGRVAPPVVRSDAVFMHCAKAFRRGRVWDLVSWVELADAPDVLDVLDAQGLVASNDAATRPYLEQCDADALAHDAPER